MVRSALLSVAFSLLTGAAMAQTVERAPAEGPLQMSDRWGDPDLGGSIVEGAATSTSLWLRGASGKLVHFDLRTGERSVIAEDVVDILPDGPHLWALVQSSPTEGRVRDLRAAGNIARPVYPQGGLVALFQTPDGPGILTTDGISMPAGERWRRNYAAGRVERYAHVSPLTEGAVFIGYNKGEWGGGLRRLEIATGALTFVRETSVRVCDGQLDPGCAPVVGVIADPETPGCVLVGTSLVHMVLRRGEVLRVCGDQISPAFSDPLPVAEGRLGALPGQTWPFDGLLATQDGWVATGQTRYARARSGVVTMHEAPPLKLWSGLRLSEPVDDVIFVQSDCCWGAENYVLRRVIAVPVLD